MKKGDTVEMIQRCGGHVVGQEPEYYEVGEKYTVHDVVMAKVRDEEGKYSRKEQGILLSPNARFAVPSNSVKVVDCFE